MRNLDNLDVATFVVMIIFEVINLLKVVGIDIRKVAINEYFN